MTMGTNPLLLLNELRGLGAATVTALSQAVPPLEAMVPTNCYLGWEVILTTHHQRAVIEDVFLFVIDDMELDIATVDTKGEPKRLGELLIDRGEVQPDAVESALSKQQPLGKLLLDTGNLTPDKLKSALAEQQHVRTVAKAAGQHPGSRRTARRHDGPGGRADDRAVPPIAGRGKQQRRPGQVGCRGNRAAGD